MTTAAVRTSTPVATPPAALDARARQAWTRLATTSADGIFDSLELPHYLPGPLRRWLTYSIAPWTPLAGAARLEMTGEIKLGPHWHHFHADQLLAPGRGYVWAATTHLAGIPVVGFDRYSDGTGEMRWRLAHILPVMSAEGDDVTASAVGRLAGELALLPTAYQTAIWTYADAPDRFVGHMSIDGRHEDVTFHIAGSGRLREVRSSRWGNPLGEPYGRYPFGVACYGRETFDGITVPRDITAGWFIGTDRWADGTFYRARTTRLTPVI